MKTIRTTALCVCMILGNMFAFAQNHVVPVNEPNYNKPRLFNNLPETISLNTETLNVLLNAQMGEQVDLNLSDNITFRITGQVVSTASKYGSSINSVVIRSTNFPGAGLTISRIRNTDNTITYTGRLMSFQHGDLYELKNQDGRFVLVKRNYYEVINE